jgi:hypothetical protein
MNIMESLGEALRGIITFVPKLLAFLVILFIGWLIAKMLRKLITVGLKKVGFDRAVERGGIQRALANSKYDAIGIVAAVVYWGILLIALQIGFGVFGPNPVSALLNDIVAWLPRLAVAIVILVIAAAAGRVLGDLASSALGGVSWGRIAGQAVFGFIVALGVIAALGQIGVATLVTAPVLIAVLATIGGILIVGVGGGMIKPMQQRWERWLGRAEAEVPKARTQMQAYQRGREDAVRAQQPTQVEQHHATVGAAQRTAPAGRTTTAGPPPTLGQQPTASPPTGQQMPPPSGPTGPTGQHAGWTDQPTATPPTTPTQQPPGPPMSGPGYRGPQPPMPPPPENG